MREKHYYKILWVLFGFLILLNHAYSPEYPGKVIGISDGDTFTLLNADKQQIKVRLSEIDAPEKAQPFGTRSRQALSDLIFSKDVLVVQDDIDRYGRLVGQIYVSGTHVNRKMVQDGMTWVYRQYLKDEILLQDEQAAKEAKRGLWSLPSTEQVPPWEWMREKEPLPLGISQKIINRNLNVELNAIVKKWLPAKRQNTICSIAALPDWMAMECLVRFCPK